MTRSLTSVLIFYLVIRPLSFHRICESKCRPNSFGASICSSDGKVYPSLCHAKCRNRFAVSVFLCGHRSHLHCSQICQQRTISRTVTSPPPVSSTTSCQSRCDSRYPVLYFCGSDGQIHKNTCHASCKSQHISHKFYCSSGQNLQQCQHECKQKVLGYNQPVYRPVTSVPRRIPVVVPRPCDDEDWVCASNGRVYEGNCSQDFNGNLRVVFNCSENGFHRPRKCQRLCKEYYRNPCLLNCGSHSTGYRCFSNGKVMKNSCLANCLNALELFSCGFKKKKCARRCRRKFRLGVSRRH